MTVVAILCSDIHLSHRPPACRTGERDWYEAMARTLDKLAAMDLSDERLIDIPPQGTRHDEVLKNAIAGITAPELHEIARCLKAAKEDLAWREDNAQFYPPGADLGEGYTKCNLHTLLIGPDACGHHHPDFSLGIFMLGPRTLYRDHNHDAPELYLNLSEKSGWLQ